MIAAKHWNALVDAWEMRVAGLGLKPKSITYQRARLEFFMGAHALALAMGEEDKDGLGGMQLVLISVGRPLVRRPE